MILYFFLMFSFVLEKHMMYCVFLCASQQATKRCERNEHEDEDIEENKDVVEDEDDELEAQQTALDDAKAAKQAYTPATKKNDRWWPNGSFSNIGLTNWHVQRAAWNVPKGKRRPLPPPFDNEAVIEGLSAQRVRHFELPGWIGLSDLIDTYVDIWEIDEQEEKKEIPSYTTCTQK